MATTRAADRPESVGIHKVVPFGEGVTDNQGVIQSLLEHGYSGYLLIEMAQSTPWPRETLKANLLAAHELFRKYERPAPQGAARGT